jgi:hypothetical protein
MAGGIILYEVFQRRCAKDLISLIILVAWEPWKRRNAIACAFVGVHPDVQILLYNVAVEGNLWCLAGATVVRELLIGRSTVTFRV